MPQLMFYEFGNEVDGPMLTTANGAGLLEASRGSCHAGGVTGEGHFGAYIGSTMTGAPVTLSAFQSMHYFKDGVGYVEVAYEHEPYVNGTIYFAEGECWPGGCAVCHYVEGPVLVSHIRPIDGECRSTLKVMIDLVRK